jgi:hypothetical protein
MFCKFYSYFLLDSMFNLEFVNELFIIYTKAIEVAFKMIVIKNKPVMIFNICIWLFMEIIIICLCGTLFIFCIKCMHDFLSLSLSFLFTYIFRL